MHSLCLDVAKFNEKKTGERRKNSRFFSWFQKENYVIYDKSPGFSPLFFFSSLIQTQKENSFS